MSAQLTQTNKKSNLSPATEPSILRKSEDEALHDEHPQTDATLQMKSVYRASNGGVPPGSGDGENTLNNSKLFDYLKIQPKLTIGQPDDKYEQEADGVADQVMRTPEDVRPSGRMPHNGSVQRTCTECEDEDSQLQRKPWVNPITPLIQEQALEDEGEKLQSEWIQVQPLEEEEELLQTKRPNGEGTFTSELESWLQSSKGGGSSLPDETRLNMEQSFGKDFSGVHIHNDSDAAQMNQQINSRAFTHGNNIYFNENRYQPDSREGKHLLAHELTHVVQQGKTGKSKHADPTQSSILQANGLEGMSLGQKWDIVYRSAINGAGEGLRLALIILLGLILVIALATIIVTAICPACIAAIQGFLATVVVGTTIGTWISFVLASLGASVAIDVLIREYRTVNQAVSTATTINDLETAGRNWGRNSAQALVAIITALFAIPRVQSFTGRLFSMLNRPGRPAVSRPPSGSTPPQPQPPRGSTPPQPRPPASAPGLPVPIPVHLRAFQQTIEGIFSRLGGNSTGYAISICDDATTITGARSFSNIGLGTRHVGGAQSDPVNNVIWVHETLVRSGSLARGWGRSLNLNQVIAHEIGHAQGAGPCALASRRGAELLTGAERIGLLDDAVLITRHSVLAMERAARSALNLPPGYIPPVP